MGIFLPQRWRQQPQGPVQVDLGHPLSAGIFCALVPHGGRFVDAAYRRSVTATGAPLVSVSVSGVGLSGKGATEAMWTVANQPSPTDATYLLIGDATNLLWHGDSGLAPGIGGLTPGINSSQFGVNIDAFTGGTGVRFGLQTFNYDGLAFSVANALTQGRRVALSASRTPGAGGHRAFVNGRAVGSSAGGTGRIGPSLVVDYAVGYYYNGTLPMSGVDMVFAAHWTRVLSDAEHAALHENPWQLFRPLRPIIYSLPTTGPTVPTLSLPGVIDITATGARPRITLTF